MTSSKTYRMWWTILTAKISCNITFHFVVIEVILYNYFIHPQTHTHTQHLLAHLDFFVINSNNSYTTNSFFFSHFRYQTNVFFAESNSFLDWVGGWVGGGVVWNWSGMDYQEDVKIAKTCITQLRNRGLYNVLLLSLLVFHVRPCKISD